jgi:hypothetical protein
MTKIFVPSMQTLPAAQQKLWPPEFDTKSRFSRFLAPRP